MSVNGGASEVSASPTAAISFGLSTCTSSLHQDAYDDQNKIIRLMLLVTYIVQFSKDWPSDVQPAGPHNIPAENKLLEHSCIGSKDARICVTAQVH